MIHPGFAKSATSTLQQRLFWRHPQLAPIAVPNESTLQQTVLRELFEFEGLGASDELLAGAIADLFESRPPNQVAVLSNEGLTTDPCRVAQLARRLHRHFPEALVLFTIRNQLDVVCAEWAASGRRLAKVPRPFVGRPVALEAWLEFEASPQGSGFLRSLHFDSVIGVYEEQFGVDRIHVLRYEDLRDRPSAFASQLAALLSVSAEDVLAAVRESVNPRPTKATAGLERLRRSHLGFLVAAGRRCLPQVMRRWIWRVARRREPIAARLSPSWHEALTERYGPGNRRLSEARGLSLDQLGYPCVDVA